MLGNSVDGVSFFCGVFVVHDPDIFINFAVHHESEQRKYILNSNL